MEQNKILLNTKGNKTFSLKTKNEQVSQNAYHRSHKKKKKKKNLSPQCFSLYTKTSEMKTKN